MKVTLKIIGNVKRLEWIKQEEIGEKNSES